MSDIDSMMEDDAETGTDVRIPSDVELEELRKMVQRQIDTEEAIAEAKTGLKQLEAACRNLSEKVIPEAMAVFGMSALKTSDGLSVTIKDEIYASIKKDNQEEAYRWLRANNFDAIIKNEIKVPFNKGQDEDAMKLMHILNNNGFDSWSARESVHPQTLRGFIKEQLEKGEDIPLSLFGAFLFQKTIIKQP